MRRLKNLATEMSLQVLAYHLKRVLAILGTGPLLAALRA
jgi:transposase